MANFIVDIKIKIDELVALRYEKNVSRKDIYTLVLPTDLASPTSREFFKRTAYQENRLKVGFTGMQMTDIADSLRCLHHELKQKRTTAPQEFVGRGFDGSKNDFAKLGNNFALLHNYVVNWPQLLLERLLWNWIFSL